MSIKDSLFRGENLGLGLFERVQGVREDSSRMLGGCHIPRTTDRLRNGELGERGFALGRPRLAA